MEDDYDQRLDELEASIASLESSVSSLNNQIDQQLEFIGTLLGRLAAANNAPDLGFPTVGQYSQGYETQLRTIRAYNSETR